MTVPLPTHRNPPAERRSTAAYNFVPLPDRVVAAVARPSDLPDHDAATPGYPLCGYFDVTLTTATPLYVRGPLSTRRVGEQPSEFERAEREKVDPPVGADFHGLAKNKPDFFFTHDPDQPVIPGSSLRGMLRSVLETASHGKVALVADSQLVYRAVGDTTALGAWYRQQLLGPNKARLPKMHFDYPSPNVRGGYLVERNGGWAIRPARQHQGESFVHVEYGDAAVVTAGSADQRVHKVFVAPAARAAWPRRGGTLTLDFALTNSLMRRSPGQAAPPGLQPAMLVQSGRMGGQHAKHMHCAIYEEDPQAALLEIPPAMWETYREDRDRPRGQRPTRPLKRTGDPLFYLVDGAGKLVFFGPTMMFRLPYVNSVHAMIPNELRDPLAIDYAEALFGFLRRPSDFSDDGPIPAQGDKARGYASRIAVTDGVLARDYAAEELWLSDQDRGALTPKILSTPKPTSFQHYLVQPSSDRHDLSFYDSPVVDDRGQPRGFQTAIRGHKRYWPQGRRTARDIEARQADGTEVPRVSTQHTRMAPIREGVSFRFRVHFDNLLDRELGALCWALHPVGPSAAYRHRLGMGKPFGMGVVALDATLHLIDRRRRYATLFDGDQWELGHAGAPSQLGDPATLRALTKPFEQHVLAELGQSSATALADLPRMAMFLRMLEWVEQPDPSWAQEVRTRQPEEFRQRPVLGDPTAYGGPTAAPRAAGPPETGQLPSHPEEASAGPTVEQVLRVRPAERQERPGATVVAVVVRVKDRRVRVRLLEDGEEMDCPNAPAAALVDERWLVKVSRGSRGALEARFQRPAPA